mgnify:CR=1 FL=1
MVFFSDIKPKQILHEWHLFTTDKIKAICTMIYLFYGLYIVSHVITINKQYVELSWNPSFSCILLTPLERSTCLTCGVGPLAAVLRPRMGPSFPGEQQTAEPQGGNDASKESFS